MKLSFMKKLFSASASAPAALESESLEEGDYRSGPHGYSPMTPYLESQYGSRFNEDAAWNDEED